MTATLQRLWEHIGRDHLVWLAALYILLSGALLALLLVALRAQELRSAERSLDAFARAMEAMTSHTLQAAHARLELVGHEITHPVPQTDGLVTRKLLQERLREMPFASALWVLDANGKVLADTASGSSGIDASGRDYFLALHNAKPGALVTGKPALGAADGHWRIPLAHALHDTGGKFLGAVVAGVDPAHFSAAWASVDLGADAVVALLRRDQTLLISSPPIRDASGQDMPWSAMFLPPLQGLQQGRFLAPGGPDGIARSFAFRTLQHWPALLLVVGRSEATTLAPWSGRAAVAALAWALTAAAVGGLSIVLHRARARHAAAARQALELGARLDLATSAAAIGVWEWDMRTDQAYGSPSYYSMLGYPARADVIDRQFWFDRCHPDDARRASDHIQRALSGLSDTYQYEVRLRHADGEYRWVRLSGRVTERDSDGHPTRLLGVRMDIHQQVLAQQKLRESEALNLAVLNSVQAHIAVLDRHGMVVALNEPWRQSSDVDRYLRARGQRPVEVGDSYLEVCRRLPPLPTERTTGLPVAEGIRAVLEHRSTAFNASYPIRSAKEKRWIALQVTPLHSEDGGAVISHADITDRIAAAENLRQMTRLYALRARINRAIIDQRTPADLLQEICRSAVAHGQFGMAWIGQTDPASGRIRPLAEPQAPGAFLTTLTSSADGWLDPATLPQALPPSAVLAIADIASHSATWPAWTAAALRQGFQSAAVVGFTWEGPLDASLHLFAREPGFFTPAERQVLADIGADISLALAALASEAARERAELALHTLLRDKEALLKEVHHRVKNNLQVVSSLLRLEAARDANTSTVSVLRDMQGRIQAMGLLHESLYGSGNFAAVDLAVYLRQLSTQAFTTFSTRSGAVRLDVNLASVQVSMDQAITCGLLVNELVSNSLKHAFPGGRTGVLRITLQALDNPGCWRLQIADDGVGLPPDLAQRQPQSLGMQLASDLADQLGGALHHGGGPGTDLQVEFWIDEAR